MDFENLDNAENRGDVSDIDYINYLNLIKETRDMPYKEKLNFNSLETKITKDKIFSFFVKYPALGWILLRTDKDARTGAVKSGYMD